MCVHCKVDIMVGVGDAKRNKTALCVRVLQPLQTQLAYLVGELINPDCTFIFHSIFTFFKVMLLF